VRKLVTASRPSFLRFCQRQPGYHRSAGIPTLSLPNETDFDVGCIDLARLHQFLRSS